MGEIIRKGFRLSGEVEENHLRGAAAVMGNIDAGNDVIYPGAFRKAIPQFLATGFVSDTHGWTTEDVVAMPRAAREQGRELVVDAEFHSDQRSQDVRTKCLERLTNGLSVGLSIGFAVAPDGAVMFPDTKGLLRHAESTGQDMTLFDAAGIRKRPGACRAVLEVSDLYEFSIVPVPMNAEATATAVKGRVPITVREFEAFLRDAGWSRADATAIASHGFSSLREAAESECKTDTAELAAAARRAIAQFRVTLMGA